MMTSLPGPPAAISRNRARVASAFWSNVLRELGLITWIEPRGTPLGPELGHVLREVARHPLVVEPAHEDVAEPLGPLPPHARGDGQLARDGRREPALRTARA